MILEVISPTPESVFSPTPESVFSPTPEPKFASFKIEFDLNMGQFESLLDDTSLRSAYETAMKGILNIALEGTSSTIYGFKVKK